MKILTFTGRTPTEALKKAKMEIGDEGMLIETKEIQKRALGREPLYEIVIGIDEKDLPLSYTTKAKKPAFAKKELEKESKDILFDISNAAKQISKISDVTQENENLYTSSTRQTTSTVEPKELKEIKNEINKLTDKVKIIQNMFWDEKSPDIESQIPPEFAEIYRLGAQSGMNKEHLDTLMQITLEHMPLKMRENSTTVKRYFQTILRKMVPIRKEKPLVVGRKKVMMFVGPTGVGKTTSIAKLAARYSFLLEKKYKENRRCRTVDAVCKNDETWHRNSSGSSRIFKCFRVSKIL